MVAEGPLADCGYDEGVLQVIDRVALPLFGGVTACVDERNA